MTGSQESFIISWKILIKIQNVVSIKLELRRESEIIEIADLPPRGNTPIAKNETLFEIIQSFSLKKLIIRNIPSYLDGYEVFICLVEMKRSINLQVFCLKYALIKSESIILSRCRIR